MSRKGRIATGAVLAVVGVAIGGFANDLISDDAITAPELQRTLISNCEAARSPDQKFYSRFKTYLTTDQARVAAQRYEDFNTNLTLDQFIAQNQARLDNIRGLIDAVVDEIRAKNPEECSQQYSKEN